LTDAARRGLVADLSALCQRCRGYGMVKRLGGECVCPRCSGDGWDPPLSQCPKCREWITDLDGFGVVVHGACGYCSHASVNGDVCGLCGGMACDVCGATGYVFDSDGEEDNCSAGCYHGYVRPTHLR